MRYFNKLDGDQLYLSPMNPDDYEIYTKWMNDLTTQVPIGNAHNLYGLNKEKEAIRRLADSDDACNYAIVLKAEEHLLGNCSLMSINHIHKTAEFGIFIGDKANRGKGYGTEAAKLILSYGFKVLNLNNIMLRVFAFNQAGIASYKKVGFKEFGKRHEAFMINGKKYDELFMEIMAKDFDSEYLNDVLPE